MLDYQSGIFIELDLGFTPFGSGGGLSLLQEEEVHDGFLLLCGYTPSVDVPDRKEGTSLVTIVGMCQSVFGYPNDEAWELDRRGEVRNGFYELQGSRWLDNVMEYNERTFGSRHPVWELRGKYEAARHFFIGSKDLSAQFLAQGLRVELFTDWPYRAVRDEALRRMDHWHEVSGAAPSGEGRQVRSYPSDLR